MNPPAMPDNAAPWGMVQALGKPAITEAWKACYLTGYEVGEAVGLAKGIGFACLGCLAFLILIMAVAMLVRGKS